MPTTLEAKIVKNFRIFCAAADFSGALLRQGDANKANVPQQGNPCREVHKGFLDLFSAEFLPSHVTVQNACQNSIQVNRCATTPIYSERQTSENTDIFRKANRQSTVILPNKSGELLKCCRILV